MAKKNSIDQLIKSEWNSEPEIKQISLFDPIANSDAFGEEKERGTFNTTRQFIVTTRPSK